MNLIKSSPTSYSTLSKRIHSRFMLSFLLSFPTFVLGEERRGLRSYSRRRSSSSSWFWLLVLIVIAVLVYYYFKEKRNNQVGNIDNQVVQEGDDATKVNQAHSPSITSASTSTSVPSTTSTNIPSNESKNCAYVPNKAATSIPMNGNDTTSPTSASEDVPVVPIPNKTSNAVSKFQKMKPVIKLAANIAANAAGNMASDMINKKAGGDEEKEEGESSGMEGSNFANNFMAGVASVMGGAGGNGGECSECNSWFTSGMTVEELDDMVNSIADDEINACIYEL